jgi:hypothetical protein
MLRPPFLKYLSNPFKSVSHQSRQTDRDSYNGTECHAKISSLFASDIPYLGLELSQKVTHVLYFCFADLIADVLAELIRFLGQPTDVMRKFHQRVV